MASSTARQIPAARVAELIQVEEERFRKARPRSHQLWTEAREVLPRGVPSSFQDAAPQPVFMERGKGSRVWDVDGNEYVDFHNGFGVMVVGHAHPKIVEAVQRRIELGSHFAQPVPDDVVVARELARRFHQPRWRFTNSGTESTLDAVRIARGFTGRERIIKIEASYHGHHDALMVSVEPPPEHMGPADDPNSFPQSEGIPDAIVKLTTVVPFNDVAALEKAFARHRDQVAAVIVEPAMMNVGIVLPDKGFLDKVKEIAHRHGALLIFDEVKTGVTIAPGGATERFGVTPDLVALAKAIGGGLPCGAVGGREDVMGVVEHKSVAQMGTFNGNPLTMAASKVTLLEILDNKAYAHFDALAETLQGGLDHAIKSHDLPFHAITLAARGGVTYRAERVRNYRDYLEIDKSFAYLSWLYQCNRGVLMAPGAEENWTLSVQHSTDDVQRYVDNFAEMARDLRA
ncbi:MAG TPA: aspartate aminotransferase family protein [Candidatus Dormibacteraeota bacterium]|nr:aspartate aminotransferase family protein [Candidatus Dormibacteraeota bacterium]